jgi:hypothetical protein
MAAAAATGAAAATPAPALPTGCTQQVEVMPASSPFETYAQGTVDARTAGAVASRGGESGVACPSVLTLKHGTVVTFGPDTDTHVQQNGAPVKNEPNGVATFADGSLTLNGYVDAGLPVPGAETIHLDGSLQFDVNGYHLSQAANGVPSATNDMTGKLPVRMSPDGAFVVGGTSPDVGMVLKPWIVQADYQ